MYAQLTQVGPLKEFGGEACGYPNHVFRGWIKDPSSGDQWQAAFCPWEPDILSRLFTVAEWREILVMRWEHQEGQRRG